MTESALEDSGSFERLTHTNSLKELFLNIAPSSSNENIFNSNPALFGSPSSSSAALFPSSSSSSSSSNPAPTPASTPAINSTFTSASLPLPPSSSASNSSNPTLASASSNSNSNSNSNSASSPPPLIGNQNPNSAFSSSLSALLAPLTNPSDVIGMEGTTSNSSQAGKPVYLNGIGVSVEPDPNHQSNNGYANYQFPTQAKMTQHNYLSPVPSPTHRRKGSQGSNESGISELDGDDDSEYSDDDMLSDDPSGSNNNSGVSINTYHNPTHVYPNAMNYQAVNSNPALMSGIGPNSIANFTPFISSPYPLFSQTPAANFAPQGFYPFSSGFPGAVSNRVGNSPNLPSAGTNIPPLNNQNYSSNPNGSVNQGRRKSDSALPTSTTSSSTSTRPTSPSRMKSANYNASLNSGNGSINNINGNYQGRLDLTDPVEEMEKKNRRLMKNRQAAKECRRKKKEYITELEQKIRLLEERNQQMFHDLEKYKAIYGPLVD